MVAHYVLRSPLAVSSSKIELEFHSRYARFSRNYFVLRSFDF